MARLYGYTPNEIAELTREQQCILMTDSDDGTQKFESYAEYQTWKQQQGIL